jgi:hypothetical protein
MPILNDNTSHQALQPCRFPNHSEDYLMPETPMPNTPPHDSHPPADETKAYAYTLQLADGRWVTMSLTRLQMLCMVQETLRQPKPGTRGPKPTRWDLAAHRITRMLEARDAIRKKGDDITKMAILEWLGIRGDKKTVDLWLEPAKLTWKEFLAMN